MARKPVIVDGVVVGAVRRYLEPQIDGIIGGGVGGVHQQADGHPLIFADVERRTVEGVGGGVGDRERGVGEQRADVD